MGSKNKRVVEQEVRGFRGKGLLSMKSSDQESK